jgi:archaemetzincin
MDLNMFYSRERKQFHSTLILSHLLKHLPKDGHKIVGITEVDIYIPILTYLFGEAQLNGQGALVSTHRLDNRYYGLPYDEKLFYQRVVKEIVHELGHTFGLIHCRDYRCVMHSSTYVEDIDLKTARFCRECQEKLMRALER